MKIKYVFANGEVSEVEVTEEMGALLLDFDRLEYNNNQKEKRRHCSLDDMDYEGEIFDCNTDLEMDFLKEIEKKDLFEAISQLLPGQQELLLKVYFENISMADIARQEGVNKSSVHKRIQRIFEQLKKVLN